MCMSNKITKKQVTLESLATTVGSVVTSVESLSDSVQSINDSLTKSINGLSLRIDDLPTRKELRASESRLENKISTLPTRKEMSNALNDTEHRLEHYIEKEINDLALTTNNEFERIHKKFDEVHIRLDDMEKHTIEFRQEFDLKIGGIQNQLDTVYTNYPNRKEFTYLDRRVKRLEKVPFA